MGVWLQGGQGGGEEGDMGSDGYKIRGEEGGGGRGRTGTRVEQVDDALVGGTDAHEEDLGRVVASGLELVVGGEESHGHGGREATDSM